MDSTEEKAQKIFGSRASFYTTSEAHKDPQVLAKVLAMAAPQPDWTVLDVATGSGHTAFALSPHVHSVVAIDLTSEMLAEAEQLGRQCGFANVTFRRADVHRLPFDASQFDLVTCRRSAHHFSNIALALQEIRRVLKPSGRLVIDDRSVPEDDFIDKCMNLLDTYHDRSHVKEYRPSEWRQMLEAAGFQVEGLETYTKHRPLTSLTNDVCDEDVQKIHETLKALTPPQREAFNLTEREGQLYINHWFVMLSAKPRA